MRALSVTSLGTYEECPLRWRFLYVEGFKQAPRGYFSLGKALHSALETYGRGAGGAPPPLDAVVATYRDAWTDEGFTNPFEAKASRELGERVLRAFYEKHATAPLPLAVERRFTFKWDGVPIQGIVDAVNALPDGTREILDYKSGKTPIQQETVDASDQLTLYQVAAEREWGDRVGRLTLYHLRTLTAVSAPRRTDERVAALHARFTRFHENVQDERFPARMGEHCPCEFVDRCPFYAHSFAFTTTEEYRRPVGMAIAEYAALAAEDAGRERVAAEIREFMERQGLPRVFGREHVVEVQQADGSSTLRLVARRKR